jgi:hypothetical protein
MADPIIKPDTVPDLLSEIQTGQGLSISAAGRGFPGHRGNNSIDPSTIFRWIKKGARAVDGTVVKLAALRVGGRWLTSKSAVARFVEALTAAADPGENSSAPMLRSPTERQRASVRAAAFLKSKGA